MSEPVDEISPRRQDANTPSRTRIKICGLRDVETALVAAEAGADFIGLNFVEASPRYVDPAVAREIAAALPPNVTTVGLFCNHTLETVVTTAEAVGLRTVQLHGEETPAYAQQLAGLKVLKAFAFDPQTITAQLEGWDALGDQLVGLLIDSPPNPDAAITGGSGEAFDWSGLVAFAKTGVFSDLPRYLLAGGLTPENVGDAIRTVRPWGVDVASGVESSRGVKNTGLTREFCAAVREADASLAMD